MWQALCCPHANLPQRLTRLKTSLRILVLKRPVACWIMSLRNSRVDVHIPSSSQCELIWQRILAETIRLL